MEEGQAEYIQNVFRFGELEVSDVMVHRTEMVTVNADDPPEEIVERGAQGRSTRAFRCGATSRRTSSASCTPRICCARCKSADGDLGKIDVMAIALPPWFVPDIRPLSEQLKAFRRRKTHFALVVDEYGEVRGW